MKDLMLDIETLGTGSDAAIIQIGACYFNRKSGKIGKTFKLNVDLQSCLDFGFTVNGDTIYWWMCNNAQAIESVTKKPRTKIIRAMGDLKAFSSKADTIWSHATVDFVIVNNAMIRDIRTLVDLAGKGPDHTLRLDIHHDALDDCIYQVEYVVNAMNKLRGKND